MVLHQDKVKWEKSCGAIIFKDGLFLLTLNRKSKTWGFPKGHVEKGETEKQTALREVKEETGLRVRLLSGFRHEMRYSPKKGVMKTVVLFLGQALSEELSCADDEIAEYAWVSYEQGMKKLRFRDSKAGLRKAKAFLERI